ncbi:MAG TPA: phasin family protein [Burkholderiaceae bacterium]|nr:phasin family protein [Burkholderiaceae bacterium]HRH04270.1 phasin family protein [Burkholderiaceae bacterium]
MVTKLKKPSTNQSTNTAFESSSAASAHLAQNIKDSAQQIWLAGLGAFSKAQAEGGKVFEALVKDGIGLQRKTQAAAEDKIAEATSRMTDMANGITAKAAGVATDLTAKATGQWDKLETIFEGRVAKALHKLGVPTAKEVQTLMKRVDELSRQSGKSTTKVVSKKAVVAKKAVTKTANNVVKAAKKRVTAKKS